MQWEQWLEQLKRDLGRAFNMDGAVYVRQTGEECWREMFNDGLSPSEAVSEEVYAASFDAA